VYKRQYITQNGIIYNHMKLLAIVVCLLLATTEIYAFSASENISVNQTTTGIPCAGYETESASFFLFNRNFSAAQKLAFEIPNIKYEGEVWNATAVVNFCSDFESIDEDCSEMGKNNATGYLKLRNNKSTGVKCLPLSNPTQPANTWKLSSFISSEGETTKGYVIEQKDNNKAVAPIKPILRLVCSKNDDQSGSGSYDENSQTLTLSFAKSNFCGFQSGKYIALLTNSMFFPILMLPIAIFLIFFGFKFVKWILFSMGFLIAIILSGIIIAGLILFSTKVSALVWVFIALGVLLFGLCIGWIFSKFTRLYLIFAGGFLGLACGNKVFEFLALGTSVSSDSVELIVLILCIIIGVWFGYYIHDHVLILATAFGGSQLFCLALGTLLKNYPDVDNISHLNDLGNLGNEEKKKLIIKFVVWTLIGLAIGITGAYVQYKKRAELRNSGESVPEDGQYLRYNGKSESTQIEGDIDSRL
jgi:hypothetical protein